MSGHDLVSLVMPAYNHASFIEEAVQSVIDQTYENIEFLVLDDGSSDNTFEVLQKLRPACEKRFARVVMERQSNQGTSLAWKRLFSQVNGRYLTALASDDVLHNDYVLICHDFLSKNNDFGAVNVESDLIDEYSRPIYRNRYFKRVSSTQVARYKTFGDFLRHIHSDIDFRSDEFGRYENLLRGNHIQQGLFFRRELIDPAACFTEKAPLEDWFLAMQIAKQTRIKFIDAPPLYHYRWHGRNTMKQPSLVVDLAKQTLRHEARIVAMSDDLALKNRFNSAFPYDRLLFKSFWFHAFRRCTPEGANIMVKVLGLPPCPVPDQLVCGLKKALSYIGFMVKEN
jgi:alpha-1,3-rhamnosyltransferase